MNARSRRLLPSLVACASLLPGAANAFVQEESHWAVSSLPVPYVINLTSIPASLGATAGQNAVDSAFASWAAPACSAWRTRNAGTTALTRPAQGDRQNSIVWISSNWPAEFSTSTIGVTIPQWIQNRSVQEADIWFNNVDFGWDMTGRGRNVDAQSIATHEEGHFLGLDHTPVASAIMYASYSGGVKRTLVADDVSGVCTLYPTGTSVPVETPDASAPDASTPASGTGLGEACDTTDCGSGLECGCFAAGPSECYCTRQCGTGAACTGATTCVRTAQGNLCIPNVLLPATPMADAGTTTVEPAPTPGAVGDECAGPQDCAAAICLHANSPARTFCSRACTNDCDCPGDFRCVAVSSGSYCVPGAGTCETPDDAGATDPEPGPDASTTPTHMADAGARPADADAPPTDDTPTDSGCGCAVPGAGTASHGAWLAVTLGALALAGARRRRDQVRL